MKNKTATNHTLTFSYLSLRRTVGLLGVSLPFILSLGLLLFFQQGVQPSISYYYHTAMGDVFVGTTCVIGFFLLSYKGYEAIDNIAGNFACVFAIGLALFPTHIDPENPEWTGYVHSVCAVLFFLTLSYFTIFLFTKTNPDHEITHVKILRNEVFITCGYVMLVCILLIGIIHIPAVANMTTSLNQYNPVFWLEAITIVAFGISWLTKGEAILNDII